MGMGSGGLYGDCVTLVYKQSMICSHDGVPVYYYVGSTPLVGGMFPRNSSWNGKRVKLIGTFVNGPENCLMLLVTGLQSCPSTGPGTGTP